MLATVVIIAVVIIITIVAIIRNAKKEEIKVRADIRTVWDAIKGFEKYLMDLLVQDIAVDADEEEFDRLYDRRRTIEEALKDSSNGKYAAKQIVKDLVKQYIKENVYMSEVRAILGFDDNNFPSDQVKFEAIMQKYSSIYSKDALKQWIIKYNLNRIRLIDGKRCYYISTDDLNESYEKENIKFNDSEMITLLSTIATQIFRGYGIIDTARDMNIDGLNIGTSGSILSTVNKNSQSKGEATELARACWLYLDGTYIHLRFMNFGNEGEIKRIITMLVRYGSKGSLTDKRGYMVTTMADKSRLLAMRPGVGECWAAWIRKFTLKNINVESLIHKQYTKNWELPCLLLKYIMLGEMTSVVTGRQGSGKTTLMTGMVEYVDRRYNIRVLELSPELYLRELYPDRNIFSAQQTAYVSAVEIQSAYKKSDAAFSLSGEISDSKLTARFIEFAMTASVFSLTSHHANTTRDLILCLRNDLIDSGAFSSMDTAEKQVLDCVMFDIHLNYTPDGKRYIERITEVVPLTRQTYDRFDEEFPDRKMMHDANEYRLALEEYELKLKAHQLKVDTEYYTRRTDREDFTTNQIMHYDLETDTYVVDNKITAERMQLMMSHMERADAMEFEKFVISNWDANDDNHDMIDIADFNAQETENIDDVIDFNDSVDALEYRDNSGVEFGDMDDVFGVQLSEEDRLAQEEDIKRKMADAYAPIRKDKE